MKVIPPLTITDTILTSTSAPETPPAAYAGGTTYALNDQVSVGAVGGAFAVYKSLQAGNTGHAPASSPTWWHALGNTYAAYDGATTYALGDIVILVSANSHHIYQSLQAANTGHAPATEATWWLDLGPTNRWAMFDILRNTQTDAPSPLTVVITPGVRINSIALLGLEADSVTVSITSGGSTVYTHTQDLRSREVLDWYDYFFEPFSLMESVALLDLPPYTDAIITVEFTSASSNVKCGSLVLGSYVYIGNIQYNAESDALNFSTVERNTFGDSLLIPRRSVPKTNQTLVCKKDRVNKVRDLREALNAAPAVWVGLDDSTDGYSDALLILGYYRRFTINVAHPDDALITLELEEI